MANEIVTLESKPLSAAEIRASINLIQEVMRSCMKKDVHYGTIPGTNKPTLYKAGSEKILATFRIAVEVDVEDLSSADCFRYRVKARGILPSGEIVGCGIGECSTDEEKYKWRGIVCPAEFDNTPEDRRRIKYAKPNNYNNNGVIHQVRTNPADLSNTALKMAKKRAQIDLTLTATGASDVFDQDIEDLPAEYVDGMQKTPAGRAAAKVADINKAADPGTGNSKKISDGQVKLLHVKITGARITEDDFKAHYKLEHIADLPADMINGVLEALKTGGVPKAGPVEKAKPEGAKCEECYITGGHDPNCSKSTAAPCPQCKQVGKHADSCPENAPPD